MQIGFNLPVSGPMAAPAIMAKMARMGEALGFDYLTMTDHIALPDTSIPGYPYSESGEFYSPDPGHRVNSLPPPPGSLPKPIQSVSCWRSWSCRTVRRSLPPRC